MDRTVLRKNAITSFWIALSTALFFFTFFTDDKSIDNLLMSFLVSTLYTVVFTFGNGFVNEYLNSKYSWIEDTRTRIIWGIVATVFVNVILVFACNYIYFILLQQNDPASFFSGNMNVINWIIINFALLISALLHAKSFMEEWKKSSKKEIVEQKLIANSANAQFETLKNQLDPHFLFNSLNVLSALIDENPAQAQKFTASMSKIYRYILEQKDKQLVTVEEELEFAKTYTALLKTRFEDSVNFIFEVSEADKKRFVVPLSLQLLLENCIKHNFATPSKPLIIKVFSANGMLQIENNLQARDNGKESSGIGLSNIVQRYHLLTKKNVFVEKDKSYFKVKIPMLSDSKIIANRPHRSEEQLAYQYAFNKMRELKRFYSSVASFSLIIPFLFLINYFTSPEYYWAFWPLLGWSIGLMFQALKTFGVGKDWEDRQVKALLKKEQISRNF